MTSAGAFDAETSWRSTLSRDPADLPALRAMVDLCYRQGRHEEIAALARAACAAPARSYEVLRLCAETLLSLRRFSDAIEILAALHKLVPRDHPIVVNLVYACMRGGRADLAVHFAKAGLLVDPSDGQRRLHLIGTCLAAGRFDEALEYATAWLSAPAPGDLASLRTVCETFNAYGIYGAALTLCRMLRVHGVADPRQRSLEAVLLVRTGEREAGLEMIGEALRLAPDEPAVLLMHCDLLIACGKTSEAADRLQALVGRFPDDAAYRTALVLALNTAGRKDEAAAVAAGLVATEETRADKLPLVLGILCESIDLDLLPQGQAFFDALDRARAETLNSSFLWVLVWCDDSATTIRCRQLHRRWGESIEAVAPAAPPPAAPPASPAIASRRPLRLGLLSSDLRNHSVGRFVEPLLRNHDRDRLRIHVYSPFSGPADEIEAFFAQCVDAHARVDRLDMPSLAQRIRGDAVDILIDLNGFTQFSRLPIVAWRVAPIQAEWLGYPFTTGLAAMDYLVADRFLRPESDELLGEKALELDGAWVAFAPAIKDPLPSEPPSVASGHVTFGTLNNVYKYGRACFAHWAAALKAVPGSRFRVVRPEVSRPRVRANIIKAFAAEGVGADRIEFLDNHAAGIPYWSCYDAMDISLDTWPLTGGTTTVDSIDRGVPVVSRFGPAVHQRISYAILAHCGVPELAVRSLEEYAALAAALAQDRERLSAYRRDLQHRIRRSALCDHDGFVRSFERAMEAVARRHGIA